MSSNFDSDYELLLAFDHAETQDRSLAIIFTSYAEKYLVDIIKQKMSGLNPKLSEKLFKPDGLLGSLQAKIDVAKALNILGEELFNDIQTMGRIRNKFAHELAIVDFNNSEINKFINKLRINPETHPEQILKGFEPNIWSNRDRFRLSARAICASLHAGLGGIPKF